MALQLFFKRSKIFLANHGDRELRFQAPAGNVPVPAPNWVRKTIGYKLGVADGSIVDLTPPTAAIPVEAPVVIPPLDKISTASEAIELDEGDEEMGPAPVVPPSAGAEEINEDDELEFAAPKAAAKAPKAAKCLINTRR